jgi:hypothetical protein
MSVNLDRLREWCEKRTPGEWEVTHRDVDGTEFTDEMSSGLGLEIEGPERPMLRGDFARAADAQLMVAGPRLAEAILDAPRVWWCEVTRDVETDPSECDSCGVRCGWVVLVPVEGEPTDALVEPSDREVMASAKYPRKPDRFGPCTCHRCLPVEGEGKL